MVKRPLNDTVYNVLDGVLSRRSVPPGAKGMMFKVIDDLRAQNGVQGEACMAEQISIQLHMLESTLRLSDRAATDDALTELKRLAAKWIEYRVSGSKPHGAKRIVRTHPLTTTGGTTHNIRPI